MEREDVVRVLRRSRVGLGPGGVILDLQVVPPEPVVEVDAVVVCTLEDGGLLDDAAAATAIVDGLVDRGMLREEAVDDHHVLRHYGSGADLIEYFEAKRRSVPADAIPVLKSTERPCLVREACRLRRLAVVG